jgi:hypothetical protein
MSKTFFDYNSGDFGYSMSGDTLMSSDGHLLSKMSDSLALDLETGELHIISSYDTDDDYGEDD